MASARKYLPTGYITMEEAVRRLRSSRPHVRRLVALGEIRTQRFGDTTYIRSADVDRWLQLMQEYPLIIKDVVERLGTSHRRVNAAISKGHLPALLLGEVYRLRESDVVEAEARMRRFCLNQEGAARLLGVHKRSVRRWGDAGILTFWDFGDSRSYDRAEIGKLARLRRGGFTLPDLKSSYT